MDDRNSRLILNGYRRFASGNNDVGFQSDGAFDEFVAAEMSLEDLWIRFLAGILHVNVAGEKRQQRFQFFFGSQP